MRYKIFHQTEYDYSLPVTMSRHLIHLEPRPSARQIWEKHSVDISPIPTCQSMRTDIFGNKVTTFAIEGEHNVFKVTVTGTVKVKGNVLPEKSIPWEEVKSKTKKPQTKEEIEASMFVFPSPLVSFDESVRRYALETYTPGRDLIEAALELNERIYNDFKYEQGVTEIGIQPAEILRERKGVCQDFAHFMIAAMRSVGLSCGYVSGYLHTRPPEGLPKLTGADATHAWCAVYIPGSGFIGFDPTNNCISGEEHITVARGRDFGDVSPLKGVITGGGSHVPKVTVNVETIDNDGEKL